MRTVFGITAWLLIGLTAPAFADTNYYQNYSQFGMNLPSTALPTGQDEIRTADGTSCRSSVGGDGAYMDMGLIGTPENEDTSSSAAAYGRLVIPLGRKSGRLDCNQLYSLEIARLKMELALARQGLSGSQNTAESKINSDWATEGWKAEPTASITPAPAPQPAAAPIPVPAAAPPPGAIVAAQEVLEIDSLY